MRGVVDAAGRLNRVDRQLTEARELARTDDPEMAAEASAEEARLVEERDRIEAELKPLLVPHDPLDDRPAIVEIRAGTGGDEAALFAADLERMYTRFVERHGWHMDLLSRSAGTLAGSRRL